MVGTVQDITERLEAEAEAERARLISAVEQTADSVMIQALDKTITYVNAAFCRLTGYAPEDDVGHYAGLLDSGHHAPEFWADMWNAVESGATWTGTIVNRRRDGSLVELETVISGLRDASGKVRGGVQTDRDVTRERELDGAVSGSG
jgi:two-component system, cell cycle sensor histidine kinase and response regulator CckA